MTYTCVHFFKQRKLRAVGGANVDILILNPLSLIRLLERSKFSYTVLQTFLCSVLDEQAIDWLRAICDYIDPMVSTMLFKNSFCGC